MKAGARLCRAARRATQGGGPGSDAGEECAGVSFPSVLPQFGRCGADPQELVIFGLAARVAQTDISPALGCTVGRRQQPQDYAPGGTPPKAVNDASRSN